MLLPQTLLVALPFLLLQASPTSYQQEIEQWRHRYEAALRADGGWLTLAGLFWLREGENTVGTGGKNSFVLPKGSAPILAGIFEFRDGYNIVPACRGRELHFERAAPRFARY